MKPRPANKRVARMPDPGQEKPALHPAWVGFIRYCQKLGYGEISQLKIQDGVPVLAEKTTRKVKFV